MGRKTGNVVGFRRLLNALNSKRTETENLGKNVKQQKKKENAAAFEVKEDFLYCQTARALVIPSNVLQESGKL